MTAARPVMPPGVEDRNADVWEPLLAIADAVGWAQEARSAAVELIGAARDAEPSLGIRLLADVRTLFDASTLDPLPTATILSRLIELPESPWGDLKGKPINDRTLAGGSANTGSSRKRFGSETRPPWGTPARTCSTCGFAISPYPPRNRNKRNKRNKAREMGTFRVPVARMFRSHVTAIPTITAAVH